MADKKIRSGFVAIVGPTNSGKSTLLNQLMGVKLSIVSPKVQTTYHSIRGIVTDSETQVILTDTPGYQRHHDSVPRLLNKIADQSASDCDVIVWVFDASSKGVYRQIEALKEKIAKFKTAESRICVLNKVDKIAKPMLLPLLETLAKDALFCEVLPLSAHRGTNVDTLKAILKSKLTEGEQYYPADMVTDKPDAFRMAELIREQVYLSTHQEVPYAAWVEMEAVSPDEMVSRVPVFRGVIHVDSESKKGILIGRKGEKLKKIGTEARKEIERITGCQIHLKLHVDVHTGWKTDTRHLHQYLGLV